MISGTPAEGAAEKAKEERMEIKTDAIVLRATDYRDADKILTLFTPSEGKITAGIKGVKKSGARLAFAAQPFAFCEYVLAEKCGRRTVVSAYQHDGFFPLRTDVICGGGGNAAFACLRKRNLCGGDLFVFTDGVV